MCGIYGIFSKTIPVAEYSGIEYLLHRGPDHHDSWVDMRHGIKLQHARLSIIDLSDLGNQPMQSSNGRVVMVFNGEIYNFEDLRKKYLCDYPIKSKGDSEVFLELFEKYGSECLRYINGIFAVGFWEKDKEILTIARDHMGVKPLYYSADVNSFCFSSEMKAILRSGFVKARLSSAAVINHLMYIYSPGETTMCENIKKVLPGHYLQIKNGKIVSKERFLNINLEDDIKASFKDAKKTLVELIQNSVQRQMISDVPVGTFLSGGLDSSTVSYFAAKQLQENGKFEKLKCFTIDTGDPLESQEDLLSAKKVANMIGAELNVIKADSNTYVDLLSDMIYQLDEPTADFAAINTSFIAKAARANGIKVLLSGSGGDDILSGYRRHSALSAYSLISKAPIPIIDALTRILKELEHRGMPIRRLKKLFALYNSDPNIAIMNLFEWQTRTTVYSLLSDNYRSLISNMYTKNVFAETLDEIPSKISEINKMLYIECKHFLADHNLNYTDKMTMQYGVETRVPLLDRELVDYCFSLPSSYKLNKGRPKFILKKCMETHLPLEIIYRSKTGFGVNLNSWTKGKRLNELYDDLFSLQSIANRDIFNYEAIKTLRNTRNDTEASFLLLSVASIELWCRRYLDHNYSF